MGNGNKDKVVRVMIPWWRDFGCCKPSGKWEGNGWNKVSAGKMRYTARRQRRSGVGSGDAMACHRRLQVICCRLFTLTRGWLTTASTWQGSSLANQWISHSPMYCLIGSLKTPTSYVGTVSSGCCSTADAIDFRKDFSYTLTTFGKHFLFLQI